MTKVIKTLPRVDYEIEFTNWFLKNVNRVLTNAALDKQSGLR